MDSFAFDDYFEQERPYRSPTTRSKPVKRKWREIEALKEREKLRKELQDIDLFGDIDDSELQF